MRGSEPPQRPLFSYVSLEDRIPKSHPLRKIRVIVDRGLEDSDALFDELYSREGRPSIPPERLLRALLLEVLFSVRSSRQLMEQLDYNLLFRWFVGLNADEPVWDASTFSKNRQRFIDGKVSDELFTALLERIQKKGLLSRDHFSVDGTLLRAWASHKSFKPKDEDEPPQDGHNTGRDFHGEVRRNDTHASTTDPDARLARKGNGMEAQLSHAGHLAIENRNGFVVDAAVNTPGGHAECEAALDMVARFPQGSTVGADKGYDRADFVEEARYLGVTPHVAQKDRNSAIDRRTTRHPGYAESQRKRKRVEEPIGWAKEYGGFRRCKLRGRAKVGWQWVFSLFAYNAIRLRRLWDAGLIAAF